MSVDPMTLTQADLPTPAPVQFRLPTQPRPRTSIRAHHTDEAALYDRQIRLWGVEAQNK